MTVNEAILLVVALSGWTAFGITIGLARNTLDLALRMWSQIDFEEEEEGENDVSS